MPGMRCCIPNCQTQQDRNKNGGFFKLPNLAKYPYRRQAVVQGAGLSEEFMKIEGKNFRICYKHYKRCDIDTSGHYLTLKKGIK